MSASISRNVRSWGAVKIVKPVAVLFESFEFLI